MCVNQMAVVQPRLIPSQLPCGLKYSSSNSGTPILSLWDNKSGISSTRSVVTLTCSVMPTAYRICKILSLFGRTMSLKKGISTMSTEDNKLLVRRLFEEVLNQRNLALIDEFFSPNHVEHASTGPVHGTEGMKQYYMIYLTAFPDTHYTVEDQIAEGDKVVTRWTARGTHKGELMGIPPTGKQGTVTGIGIARFEGGNIVEAWTEFDALGMMQQLGVVPSMG